MQNTIGWLGWRAHHIEMQMEMQMEMHIEMQMAMQIRSVAKIPHYFFIFIGTFFRGRFAWGAGAESAGATL